jgi:hypothetical protein
MFDAPNDETPGGLSWRACGRRACLRLHGHRCALGHNAHCGAIHTAMRTHTCNMHPHAVRCAMCTHTLHMQCNVHTHFAGAMQCAHTHCICSVHTRTARSARASVSDCISGRACMGPDTPHAADKDADYMQWTETHTTRSARASMSDCIAWVRVHARTWRPVLHRKTGYWAYIDSLSTPAAPPPLTHACTHARTHRGERERERPVSGPIVALWARHYRAQNATTGSEERSSAMQW